MNGFVTVQINKKCTHTIGHTFFVSFFSEDEVYN